MKKYGKIIIAFMWLGLTMIMIVGATFAWFSENRNVEANGMSVQAETVKNLVIANSGASSYDYKATATYNQLITLEPASTTTLPTFFTTTAAARTTSGYIKNSDGKQDTTVSLSGNPFVAATIADNAVTANTKYQVVKHTFNIKSVGAGALTNLYVSGITVKNNSDAVAAAEISKALRVAFVCGTEKQIYAPVAGYSQTTGISAVDGTDASVTLLDTYASSNALAATVGTDSPVVVDVYIWYEGQDAACKNANGISVEALTITINFAVTDSTN